MYWSNLFRRYSSQSLKKLPPASLVYRVSPLLPWDMSEGFKLGEDGFLQRLLSLSWVTGRCCRFCLSLIIFSSWNLMVFSSSSQQTALNAFLQLRLGFWPISMFSMTLGSICCRSCSLWCFSLAQFIRQTSFIFILFQKNAPMAFGRQQLGLAGDNKDECQIRICNQLKAQAACTLQLMEMVPGLMLVGVATPELAIANRGPSTLCTTGAVLQPSITVTNCPRQSCREAAQSMAFFFASLNAFPLAKPTWSVLLVKSKEIPLRIMPLTAATPSMIFPRVVVLVPTMGTVTVRLSLAICPTTVDAPLANEVLGQTLKEEAQQLLLVSPFAVSTPNTQLTLFVSQATAALTVLPPTVTCRLIVAVSGAACTVADPQIVIVLSVQHTCVPKACMQALMGEVRVICAYPAASKMPRRNTFGTVMIRLQMEKLISNIRGIEIIIINKRDSSQFALTHSWSPFRRAPEGPARRGSTWRSQNRKGRSCPHSGRQFSSLSPAIFH